MSATAELVGDWAQAAAPPPSLTVSQWAEAHRKLPETSGGRGAPWRNAAAPYLAGVMDAVLEPGVRKIAVRKAAQIGGSECLSNILAYFIEYDPCPILVVQPSISVAEEWSKERLADMIRTTPSLSRVVREKRASKHTQSDGSTLSLKLFPGGFLAIGGANTPNTFARRAVRLAFGDDVDRWPPVVGEEGDPADLLVKRITTFHDGIVIMVSTPTLKGGRIDTLYDASDQRQYVLVCPRCRREDWITWNDPAHFRIAFDERDPDTARLACPAPEFGGCGAAIDEATRRRMVSVGRWQATTTAKEQGLVGFHLPAMITTLGNATLSTWVDEWLTARSRGRESLRVFINTTLAEGWEDRGPRIEAHSLLARREFYGAGIEVPAPAPVLTCGVDVQLDRFELQMIAWGMAGERWVIDWRTIPGDPRRPETRAVLLDALSRHYQHASGHPLPIHATCIDSGYATDEVYEFVLLHQARRIFCTKGYAGRSGEPIVGKPAEKRHGFKARPVRVYPINVDDAKADIINSLSMAAPGPSYMHFPELVDEEYFAQLTAEHRETKYNKLNVATHQVWLPHRERNEALDTAVLALAAFRMLRPNIAQERARLETAPRTTPAPVPAPTPPPRPRWIGPRRGDWLRGR